MKTTGNNGKTSHKMQRLFCSIWDYVVNEMDLRFSRRYSIVHVALSALQPEK